MKKFGSGYMGLTVGVIFGAIVATLTSYSIFAIAGGDMSSLNTYKLKSVF